MTIFLNFIVKIEIIIEKTSFEKTQPSENISFPTFKVAIFKLPVFVT